MTRILCLWFPHWPLERLLASQPELRSRNILLYEQPPQGGLRLVASNDPSARPGMPLAEALAMVQNRRAGSVTDGSGNEHVHLEPHDPWADRQVLIELAEACRRFSPTVGIEDSPRPSCLFLDLTGLATLYASEEALIEQIVRSAECGMRSAELAVERTFTVRAAVADTLGAAWGLARYDFTSSFMLHPSSLLSLPLAALRLPPDTLALLSRLGLHRVGQVEALPRDALASRFGPQLLLRLDQMFGRAAETLLVPRTAAELVAECSFETPIEDQEILEAACRELVRQVAAPLVARQEGVVQLECRFQQPPHEPALLSVGLFRPSAAVEHLWELLRLRLESVRLSAGVTDIRLEVHARAPLAWQQQELFDTDRHQHSARQTALLIDRLSNRLGRQAVVRPVLLSDAQPEHACLDLPLAGEAPRATIAPNRRIGKRSRSAPSRSPRTATVFQPDERPVFLKKQPLLLHDVHLRRGGIPRAFALAGRRYRLVRVWGPERIETGWWRSGLVRRDYYRVETVTGSRYWLFRDLRSDRWFLHGEFA